MIFDRRIRHPAVILNITVPRSEFHTILDTLLYPKISQSLAQNQ